MAAGLDAELVRELEGCVRGGIGYRWRPRRVNEREARGAEQVGAAEASQVSPAPRALLPGNGPRDGSKRADGSRDLRLAGYLPDCGRGAPRLDALRLKPVHYWPRRIAGFSASADGCACVYRKPHRPDACAYLLAVVLLLTRGERSGWADRGWTRSRGFQVARGRRQEGMLWRSGDLCTCYGLAERTCRQAPSCSGGRPLQTRRATSSVRLASNTRLVARREHVHRG